MPIDYSKPLLMGILNVTPDSFSDGGAYPSSSEAIACGIEMVAQGADIIDVGGESTRPGAERIDADEQKRRVIDVISALRTELPDAIHISIDTTLSEVARAALDSGATMLNDVSAGRDDPALLKLAAESDVPICLMHMLGEPATMQRNPEYENVTCEVSDFLLSHARQGTGYWRPAGEYHPRSWHRFWQKDRAQPSVIARTGKADQSGIPGDAGYQP